jgi:hypothetical protein
LSLLKKRRKATVRSADFLNKNRIQEKIQEKSWNSGNLSLLKKRRKATVRSADFLNKNRIQEKIQEKSPIFFLAEKIKIAFFLKKVRFFGISSLIFKRKLCLAEKIL